MFLTEEFEHIRSTIHSFTPYINWENYVINDVFDENETTSKVKFGIDENEGIIIVHIPKNISDIKKIEEYAKSMCLIAIYIIGENDFDITQFNDMSNFPKKLQKKASFLFDAIFYRDSWIQAKIRERIMTGGRYGSKIGEG